MNRMDRVNQQVKREIGLILQQEMSDPRVQFVSITNVAVSKDFRNARVFFSVLNSQDQLIPAQNALQSSGGRIRGLLSKRLNMRYTPELSFAYDSSIDNSLRIEEKLKELNDGDE